MGDQPESRDVDMHDSASQEISPENGAPTSPRKRERSSSSVESPPSDYHQGQRVRISGGRADLQCDQCGLTFRKHSDLKKHNARHSRQYRCIEDACPRSSIGFATINDLYRHEKSVHGKHVGKSRMYKCFAPGCAKASKLWPRLDNFKQHLIRMHPAEDIDLLVKKSEQWHADEEDGEGSQGLGNTQESVISSLQNVKRLRSPARVLTQGPLMSPTDKTAAARWDLTPPTTAMIQGPRPEVRPMTDPLPPRPPPNSQLKSQPIQTPTPATVDGHRELLQRPPESHPTQPQAQQLAPPPPPPPPTAAPPVELKPINHIQSEPRRDVGPRPEQLARVIHNTEEPGPIMQPDDTREISRAAEVRELAPEARCLSCQHYNRRCYMDQSNPWQCVACPSAQHCIFRRTVVREGPTSSFSWAELVGIQNLARKAV